MMTTLPINGFDGLYLACDEQKHHIANLVNLYYSNSNFHLVTRTPNNCRWVQVTCV